MAVYYATTPVLPNETLMIAGAGLEGATAKLCTDKDCASDASLPMVAAESTVDAWNKSIKMVLPPAGCGPPCYVQIKATQGTPSTTTVAVNQPDVWWASTGSPGRPTVPAPRPPPSAISDVKATVAVGDTVRVFGRSLGWTTTASAGAQSCWGCAASQLICADGKNAPTATATKLLLTPGGLTRETTGATCYEANFDTAGLAPGVYNAVSGVLLLCAAATCTAFGKKKKVRKKQTR